MSYTRQTWAIALAHAVGNNNPTQEAVNWLVAWTLFETSHAPGASYNLLNTTEPNTPGVVSNFNSAGVKNYDTFEHGIEANAKVLRNGRYPVILKAVQGNDLVTLSSTAIDGELHTWGTGNVSQGIVSRLGDGLQDEFPGEAPTLPVPSPTPPPVKAPKLWTKYGDIRFPTGIASSWQENPKLYGSPYGEEQSSGDVRFQEFENATCFWIGHKAFWRVYTSLT